MYGDNRRQAVLDATLEVLRHTVGRDEHMPYLRQLVASRAGPMTFATSRRSLERST
jgi:hypothetical protein